MPSVAVIIPTLNEARYLPGLLRDLCAVRVPTEVIVVDGGSSDDTVSLAARANAKVVRTGRGRGLQMNAGAHAANAPWLCFLHADLRLSAPARSDLEAAVVDPRTDAAVWRLSIDARGVLYRVFERGALLRDRLGGLAYGDQGLLVRRSVFEAVGGFPEVPIMEDVIMIGCLRRLTRLRRFESAVRVSARRWKRDGPLWTWCRNTLLIAAFLAGVDPSRLAGWYRPHGE